MNNTKQGYSAGQSTRVVVNNATHTTVEVGKTVATTVGGFLKGFFTNPDQPKVITANPKRIARSAK